MIKKSEILPRIQHCNSNLVFKIPIQLTNLVTPFCGYANAHEQALNCLNCLNCWLTSSKPPFRRIFHTLQHTGRVHVAAPLLTKRCGRWTFAFCTVEHARPTNRRQSRTKNYSIFLLLVLLSVPLARSLYVIFSRTHKHNTDCLFSLPPDYFFLSDIEYNSTSSPKQNMDASKSGPAYNEPDARVSKAMESPVDALGRKKKVEEEEGKRGEDGEEKQVKREEQRKHGKQVAGDGKVVKKGNDERKAETSTKPNLGISLFVRNVASHVTDAQLHALFHQVRFAPCRSLHEEYNIRHACIFLHRSS